MNISVAWKGYLSDKHIKGYLLKTLKAYVPKGGLRWDATGAEIIKIKQVYGIGGLMHYIKKLGIFPSFEFLEYFLLLLSVGKRFSVTCCWRLL